MKVYSFSKHESVVNKNGNIKRYKRVVQHDGKKGIEQVENNGKVKTRRFKVRNNKRNNTRGKCRTVMPSILALKRRNNKSNYAKGVTKRRKVNKRKKGKKGRRKYTRKVRSNSKGFWERLFF